MSAALEPTFANRKIFFAQGPSASGRIPLCRGLFELAGGIEVSKRGTPPPCLPSWNECAPTPENGLFTPSPAVPAGRFLARSRCGRLRVGGRGGRHCAVRKGDPGRQRVGHSYCDLRVADSVHHQAGHHPRAWKTLRHPLSAVVARTCFATKLVGIDLARGDARWCSRRPRSRCA